MTDKVALVRLRAKNDQYDSAMAKSTKLTNDLAATSTKFKGISQELGSVGSTLNRNVTLPLTLAGAASVKLASDFNTTFTRMATLAGVPVDQLGQLKQAVLDLARETGQAPAELAESLYQIYSSGVPASEAMSVLKASAQGAALGLGEAAGVADAVTSAINTYGAGNLTAAQAADQLTAAVRAGKGEAAAFAPQLGNLLPLASELGISFADTAGSLAYLTRSGNTASVASTKLEGVMRALVKPTQQGRDVLEQVGLSAEKLRQVVAEQGLPAALDLLQQKFAGNSELMGKFFEDSEGYIGNLALMKNGGEEWAQVLQEVNDSQGLVAEGMRTLQETPEFKMQQALADLQATAVELGTALMPILAGLAGGIADLANVFNSLPGPVQAGLVAIGLFAASLGPLVSLVGNASAAVAIFTKVMNARQLDSFRLGLMGVTEAGAGASNALGGVVAAAGGASVVMPVLGAAVLGAGLIMWDAKNKADQFAGSMKAIREEAAQTGRTDLSVFADSVAKLWNEVEGGFNIGASDNAFRKAMDAAGVGLEEFTTALAGTDKEWQAFVDRVVNAAIAKNLPTGPLIEDLNALRAGQQQAAETTDAVTAAQRAMAASSKQAADEAAGLTTETDKATHALSEQADAILGVLDARRGALDAADAYNQSIVAVAEAQQAEADAVAAVGDAEQGVADARERAAEAASAIADAEQAVIDARKGVEEATRNVAAAERDAADAREQVTVRTQELADAQREASGDSDEMRDALQGVADAEDAVARAQEDSLTAQQRLDDARANYSRTLAGLQRDAEAAADAVIAAEIRIRDAQENASTLGQRERDRVAEAQARLNKVLSDGTATAEEVAAAQKDLADAIAALPDADDRARAELAVRDALRDYADAQERATDAADEAARVEAAGVEGSDEVVAARDGVAAAADREAEAQGRLEDAVSNVADTQEAANQRVEDAQRNLEDAILARANADQRVIDAKDGVVAAQGEVAKAVDGVHRANRDAAEATAAVDEAQKNVVEAKQAVVDAHAAVEKKLRDVEEAAIDAAVAVFMLDEKTGNAATGADDLAEKLRALAEKMDPNNPLRRYILDTARELDDLAGTYDIQLNLVTFSNSSLPGLVSLGATTPGFANAEQGLASGGPTVAGKSYLVGEKGPEIWTAGATGYVTPAHISAQVMAQGTSGGGGSWSIDYKALGAAVAAAMPAQGPQGPLVNVERVENGVTLEAVFRQAEFASRAA